MSTLHRFTLVLSLFLTLPVVGAVSAQTKTGSESESAEVLARQAREALSRGDENVRRNAESTDYIRALARGEAVAELPDDGGELQLIPDVPRPSSDDPVALMTYYMTGYTNDSIRIHNRYMQDLSAIPVEALLAPATFAKPNGAEIARRGLAEARAAFDLIASRMRTRTAAYFESVTTSQLPSETISGFKESFQNGKAVEETLAAEEAVLRQIEVIQNVIIRHRPTVRDGMLLFPDDYSLSTYNAELTRLADLMDAQTKLARYYQSRQADRVKQIEAIK